MIQALPHETAFMIFRRVFEVCTMEQCVLTGMISWGLWNRRNRWVWERINGSAFGVRMAATNTLADWKEAQSLRTKKGTDVGDHVWRKPMEGWIKVNTDAAVFNDGSIGVGGVMRNSQGAWMGGRCCKVRGSWTPREAEAIGLKEVLSWVIKKTNTCCIIETDSQVLVNACKGDSGEALFGTIVGDCIQLLKHINPVLVKFVYRSANRVAHAMEKASYSMSDVEEWGVTPPEFIMPVLQEDLI